MFKFRRSSLCSNPEVVTNNSSSDEDQLIGLEKNGLRNSISDPRLPQTSFDSPDEKESLSDSSLDSILHSFGSTKSSTPFMSTISSSTAEVVFEKCRINRNGDSNLAAAAMSDRKRKERHESSSQEQEKKVIRGNDPDESSDGNNINNNSQKNDLVESTPTPKVKDDLLLPPKPITSLNTSPQMSSGVRIMPMDSEPEIQRQWERTASQWNARKSRRQPRSRHATKSTKSFSDVDEDIGHKNNAEGCQLEGLSISNKSGLGKDSHDAGHVVPDEPDSSPQLQEHTVDQTETGENDVNLAPLPQLDLSTLHESVDSSEPISACRLHYSDHAMLSPRNHTLIKDTVGLHAPSPPLHQSPVHPPSNRQTLDYNQESRINVISKQIGNFKKQARLGSLGNSLGGRKMRFSSTFLSRPKNVSDESLKQLENLVGQVQRALAANREVCGTSADPLLMTQQELVNEKNAMQRQLLFLERRYGRPETKEEKDLVKNLYSRYRLVKKLSFRFSAERENSFDLVPIKEHEALELDDTERDAGSDNYDCDRDIDMTLHSKPHSQVVSSNDTIDLKNEDFNEMTLPELESKHKLASGEKKRLRNVLRKFEVDFQNNTGRAPLKEDKYYSNDMEKLYHKYKHYRANTKLLEVLIEKKKFPFSRVDLGKVED